MAEPVRGEIVAIGTEMLLGDLIDTNSAFIADQLKSIGVNMYFKTTVGDNLDRIAGVIKQAHERSQVVITTGGLGPTVDDLTREACAKVMGVELEFRQDLYDYISAYFSRRGFHMSENNKKQAYIPAGATPIENPRGTAPCFMCEDERGVIIVSPGVPHEMRYIITQCAVPILQEKFDLGEVIRTKVLKTCGLGESRVDEMISELFRESVNPSIGVLAHPGQVDVRITARAKDIEEANNMIAGLEVKVREILGSAVYATGNATLEETLARVLAQSGKTIAIVESNTGGALIQRLNAWPERVQFLKRGVVGLHAEELARMFGVDEAEDPESFAKALARRIREESDADLGLAVFGPNPPENIEPENSRRAPALGDTHMALDTGGDAFTFTASFGGNEQFVQSRAPIYGMELVRRAVLGLDPLT